MKKMKTTLILLICLGFVALNTFAQEDEPYLVIGDGHWGGVNSVAFHPDGNKIASASADGTIKLWNPNTGVVLRTLTGYSVAFHPDGNTIASGSDGNTIKLWDSKTGEHIKTITGHRGDVNSVAFHPDGNKIASTSWDGTIKLWDTNTGELLNTLTGHTDNVYSVAFSPDGNTIASGSSDNTIRLWDTNTGELLNTIGGHTDDVYSVAFYTDGNTIASASADETIKLWDVKTGEFLKTLTGHTYDVYSVAFSPDGNKIASASGGYWVYDKTIKLWDAHTGENLKTLEGHTYDVYSVAFSPDGNKIASGGKDNTIRLWDANTGEELNTLARHYGYYSIAFSPDGNKIASASGGHRNDDKTKLWDAHTGENLKTLGGPGHRRDVKSVAFSPDGNKIASASWDNTIKLWDADTGELLNTLAGHYGYSIAFSPDGNKIASAGWDNTIKLWNTNTGELLNRLEGHTDDVYSVAFYTDGNTIASASADETIKLWNPNTGELLKTIGGNIRLLGRHTDHVVSVAFHPDGNKIASASSDNTIKLWDTNTGELLNTLEGHTDHVNSVAFHPDGNKIASASSDNTIKLWDTNTGELLNTLEGHTDHVNSVAFHPDGNKIASAGWDGTIKLWHVEPAAPTPKEPRTTVSLSKSSIVAPNKTFTLDAILENTGGVSAAATLQFYGPVKVERTTTQATSGTLPAIDFTDKTLGEPIDIAAMAVDSTRKETITTTAPATAGTYAYKACIQRADGAGGTDEICSDVFTVTIAPPDLQFVKVWAEPATVAPGATFKLYATVSNAGGKSDRTTLWWYSLGDSDNTEEPEELQGTRIDSLPMADGKTVVTKHITVTASETPGTYSYRLSIDSVEGEGDTDNNSSDFKITVALGGPDLVIDSVQASHLSGSLDSLKLGDNEITLSATVKNIGTAKSDSTTLRFYRSANAHLSIDDTKIASDVEVPPLNPQETFIHSINTTAGHATKYPKPSIYYFGVLVGSPSNEINTDNNWSVANNIVKVIVDDAALEGHDSRLRLNVPPNFISEVAYSQGYTYFLLTAQCLPVAASGSEAALDPDLYTNQICTIRLYLPSDNLSRDPVDNPAYFMFHVEVPRDKLGDIAEEGAGDVFKSVIFTALGELAGKIVKSVGGIFFASFTTGMEVGEIIMNYHKTHAEAEAQTPTVALEDPDKAQLCLFLIPGRLSSVEISILQKFTPVNTDDTLIGAYGNIWNLEETWRLENPDVTAAPGAPSMSLTDYPLFQYLPSEVQAYILQYFGEDGGIGVVHPETLQIPQQTSLLANYPNPFNPETWIPYQLAKPADVKLTIYDINGHVVRDLDLGHQRAGTYRSRSRAAHWDGKNESGEPVASGVYFYKFTAGDFSATRKMLIRK